ncbi:surface glycoprotein [Halobacterium sp. KA-4]|uniref:beta strand repeat-containing protein n=1 Tax=Halobacterium sp. KA-4 TaxID=2896367 RepID=UPI001E36DBF6|nr:surface glycoprotein [Halobacterium sp. KA-4]MCD2201007.1 surface glycoprotein [Halobacterium sp. KA-4]
MSSTSEKLRAVFLTALMIGSVFAAGVAFTGTAAAANTTTDATTADTNNNGQIDQLTLTFDESMDITDGNANDALPGLSVSDYTIADGDYAATGTGTLELTLVEGGSADTDATPSVSYDQSVTPEVAEIATNSGGTELADGEQVAAATDGASPIVTSVEQTGAEWLTFTFSEPVQDDVNGDDGNEDAQVAQDDVEYVDGDGQGVSGFSSSSFTADTPDSTVVAQTNQDITTSDLNNDAIHFDNEGDSTDPSEIGDPHGNILAGPIEVGLSTSTLSATSLASASTVDSNSDGTVDQIDVTFNGQIDEGTVDASDFSVSNPSATVDSVLTGTDDKVVTLEVSGLPSGDTSVKPQVTALAGTLSDESGATGPSIDSTVIASDSAEPVLLSAKRSGADAVQVTFSESVEPSGNFVDELTYIDNNGIGATALDSELTPSGPAAQTTVSTNNDIADGDIGTDAISADGSFVNTDPVDTPATLQYPSGFSLAGDSNNEISTSISSADTESVLAGSHSQELGLIKVKDISGGDSPLAERTILNLPDGVTINESQTDLLVTTTSGNLAVTGTTIVDENTLRISHSGSSESGQTLRVSGLVVDTAPDVAASQGGQELDIEVDYATGNFNSGLLTTYKPGTQLAGSPSVAAGGTSTLGEGNDLTVTTATVDNQIANQTNIVIHANESNGITFDTSVDPAEGGDNIVADSGVDSGTVKVDDTDGEISLTESEITIPVTANFTAGDTLTIDGSALSINATGTASSGALFNVETETLDSTGPVTAEQTAPDTTVTVKKPKVVLGNAGPVTQTVGLNGQIVTESDTVGTSGGTTAGTDNAVSVTDTSGGQMVAGTNVTLTLNNSDVTFDTSRDASPELNGDYDAGDNDGDDSKNIDAQVTGDVDVGDVTIHEHSIEVSLVDEDGSATAENERLLLDDVYLNASSDLADATDVHVISTTQAGTDSPDVTATSNETDSTYNIQYQKPNVAFNNAEGDNATMPIDNDGRTGFEVGSDGIADDAIDINGDSSTQAAANTYVNITLESGTGVTFDTSKAFEAPGTAGGDGGETMFADTTESDTVDVQNTTVTEDTLAIGLHSDAGDGLDAGESIRIDQVFLNGTSGASNTTLSVTTNTGDSDVTTNFDQFIITQGDEPGGVYGDASFASDDVEADEGDEQGNKGTLNRDDDAGADYGATGTHEATDTGTVGSTFFSSVYVEDGAGAFGAAPVSLEIVKTPDGASGQSLNTTSVTTASNGVADFEFTAGDSIGEYIVNASTDNGQSVNITYTVTAGKASQLNVSTVDNALRQTGPGVDENEVAAVRVRIEDSGGNLVQNRNVDVGISLTGSAELAAAEVDYDITDNGQASGNILGDSDDDGRYNYVHGDDAGQAGDFYIFLQDGTAEDIDVTVTPDSAGSGVNAVSADTGTATFFDRPTQTSVTLNESSVAADTDVAVHAVAQTDSGTTIEVPRLNVGSITSNNTTVATISNADGATNTSGVATALATAQANGTSIINATVAGNTGSTTLTVTPEAAPTGSVTFNDQTVQNGTSTVTVASVNASVDYYVDVHGSGIDSVDTQVFNASEEQTSLTVDLGQNLTANTTLTAAVHAASDDAELATDSANITVSETALTPTEELAAQYDADDNGELDSFELLNSIDDYQNDQVTSFELLELIEFYQDNTQIPTSS